MADKIKKLKVKQTTGIYGDYIPLGADAANVDLTNGQTVEENINYINTELLVAKDVIDEVTASSFTLPIASNLVLGGIKIGEGLSIDENGVVTAEGVTDYNDLINTPELAQIATSGSYNDLLDKPTIPAQYVLPIATAADLGGIRIGTGLNIDATGVVSVDVGVTDYNDLENLPDLTVYAKTENLSAVATSGDYNDLSNSPVLATIATSGSYNDLNNVPTLATVATSGNYNDLSNKPTIPSAYTLPTASSSTLGGVKVGTGLSISSAGVLSATATSYTLPTASTSTKGGITVDGTLLAMSGTMLTAPGYLPLTGGTMTGDIVITGSGTYQQGGQLGFGDIPGRAYIAEIDDDYLTLYGYHDILFNTDRSGSTTLGEIIDSLGGSGLQYVEGSYTGDGDTYQTISLDFTPFLVIITARDEEIEDPNYAWPIAVMMSDMHVTHYYDFTDGKMGFGGSESYGLTSSGFRPMEQIGQNTDGEVYWYVAFGT